MCGVNFRDSHVTMFFNLSSVFPLATVGVVAAGRGPGCVTTRLTNGPMWEETMLDSITQMCTLLHSLQRANKDLQNMSKRFITYSTKNSTT